jgi:hypothetical protein
MQIGKCLGRCLGSVMVAALVCAPILAADVVASAGAIVGVVTNASSSPVAHAMVIARKSDGSSIRATLSGADGLYAFPDLPAGSWSITAHVDGTPDVSASVTIAANAAARSDFVLAAPNATTPAPATAAAAVAAMLPNVPEALQAPDPAPAVDTVTPLANVPDIGWMNGNTRETTPIFDTKFFTPEIRFDTNYLQDFNNPADHTIVGSTEEFRSGEFQVEQVSLGGNFHWHNVQARFLSMMGLFAVTTPRNDASAGVGQWDLNGAYKYLSEANAGYHWDNIGHGLNVDAGIFVSYIGLFSYYNFDNWTYQPSFVSSNTPWFFNGLRIQYWPTQNLKIEPWLINGWQSYAKFNQHPGFGGQILWIPSENLKMVFNSYSLGQDNLSSGNGVACNGGNPNAAIGSCTGTGNYINYAHVQRIHEDDSLLYKYYDNKASSGVSKMAFSLTWDAGCESGGGTSCSRGPDKETFLGVMAYDRTWWDQNKYAVTIGGGAMNNPGRYLALLPPINGATAPSGSPYFTENPGQKLYQWDTQLNLQYMPLDWITWWTEGTFRHSDVPYWSGQGGVTPPTNANSNPGGQQPNEFACTSGGSGTLTGFTGNTPSTTCGPGNTWFPDLRKREFIWGAGVMVKF